MGFVSFVNKPFRTGQGSVFYFPRQLFQLVIHQLIVITVMPEFARNKGQVVIPGSLAQAADESFQVFEVAGRPLSLAVRLSWCQIMPLIMPLFIAMRNLATASSYGYFSSSRDPSLPAARIQSLLPPRHRGSARSVRKDSLSPFPNRTQVRPYPCPGRLIKMQRMRRRYPFTLFIQHQYIGL